LAFVVGRAYALALVIEHGQWLLDRGVHRGAAIARRLAATGLRALTDLGSSEDVKTIIGA
jgi:hypothetical protein